MGMGHLSRYLLEFEELRVLGTCVYMYWCSSSQWLADRTSSTPPHTHTPTTTTTGHGRHSSVRGCVKRVDGCPYAVKRLSHPVPRNALVACLSDGRGPHPSLREAFAWAALADCPKLVRCVFWDWIGLNCIEVRE